MPTRTGPAVTLTRILTPNPTLTLILILSLIGRGLEVDAIADGDYLCAYEHADAAIIQKHAKNDNSSARV